MPKIISAFSGRDPLGAALSNLGKQLYGDQTSSMLNQEKLYAAQRENTETDNLMSRVAGGGGVQAMASDPVAQAILLGSGYDPSKFGNLGLLGAATEYGAADPRTQNFQVGTGQSYRNTADAFNADLGETYRNNNLQSADRRYGVDQTRAQDMFEFGNVSANDQVRNAETFRNNNLTSDDRRYGVDQTRAQDLYEFDNVSANDQVRNAETYRNNDLQSADRRYNVDRSVGESARQFDQKPTSVLDMLGNPTFAPQADVANGNFQPVLSNTERQGTLAAQNWDSMADLGAEQQQYLGARPTERSPGTPRNYRAPDGTVSITYDGVTDAQTNQPLAPGGFLANVEGGSDETGLTNSTTSGLQQQDVSLTKFGRLIGMTREIAQRDPSNFGVPGFVKGVAQDVTQLSQGLATGLGFESIDAAVQETMQDAARNGISPALLSGVYDPNLTELNTISDLMVYSAAEALAGQSGRSVSDKDVQFFKQIVGDPRSWLMNQNKFLSKLDQIERILGVQQSTVQDYLGGGAGGIQPAAPAAPVDPAVDPLGAARDAISRGADRDAVIQRLQQNGINPEGL